MRIPRQLDGVGKYIKWMLAYRGNLEMLSGDDLEPFDYAVSQFLNHVCTKISSKVDNATLELRPAST